MGATDTDLLRDYAQGSEAAFAALVERHLNLVYSAARRQVQSPELAEEVTQSVFCDLARQAARFPRGTALNGWLYLVTRRTAIDTRRRESRRLAHEQTAAELALMHSMPSAWSRVEPLLDEAMTTLSAVDRTAVLLRFFENKNLRDVGEALGVSDDAAQKRVSRALEHLRAFFLRRGVAVTAAVLAQQMGAHAIVTAPASLLTALSTPTFAFTASAATAAMTTAQKSALVLSLALLAGFGIREIFVVHPQRDDIATVSQPAAARARSTPVPVSSATPKSTPAPDAPGGLDQRVVLLRQILEELPAQRLPEIRLLDTDDWLAIARKHELDSSADIRMALAELRALARRNIAVKLQEALRRYIAASGGQLPEKLDQLASFLPADVDAEMLARYEMTRTGRPGASSEYLIREKGTSDLILSIGLDDWDVTNNADLPAAFGESDAATLERISRAVAMATDDDAEAQTKQAAAFKAVATLVGDAMKSLGPNYRDEMKRAATAFAAAYPDETLTDVGQIPPFLNDPDKFVATLRPVLAHLEFAREHDDQMPSSPDQLKSYLTRPFSAAEAFRAVKIKLDHGQLSLDFDF